MSRRFIVHIGFSKTGTTSLQKHLFRRHSQIAYLGKPYESEVLEREIQNLFTQETSVYDSSALEQHVSQNLFNEKTGFDKVFILSEERLVSYSKVRDRGIVAERLKSVLKPDGILITIRNQFDILKAAYLSRGRLLLDVPDRYSGRFVKLEEWLEYSYKNGDRSYIGHVDYFKTVSHYAKLFGNENTCVLLFEEFVATKDRFVQKLSDFLDIEYSEALQVLGDAHEHRDMGQTQLDYERWKGGFSPLTRIPVLAGLLNLYFNFRKHREKDRPATVEFPNEWIERLSDFYKEGNRNMIRDFDLPLERYGYPV